MRFQQLLSPFFASAISACLWATPILAADFRTEEKASSSLASLSQAEFDQLKKDKSQEIWLSEEIDAMTRFGYMESGVATGVLRALIDKSWPEFYATNKDPSGKDWTLRAGQQYDLDGNIVNK